MLTQLAGLGLLLENVVAEGFGVDIASGLLLLGIAQAVGRICSFPALEKETARVATSVSTCCGKYKRQSHTQSLPIISVRASMGWRR